MGSYSYLRLAEYEIWSTKCDIEPIIMTLYSANDKIITTYPPRPELGDLYNKYAVQIEDVVKYSASLHIIKDRLELMGFTLPHIKTKFEHAINFRLDELSQEYKHPWSNSEPLKELRAREKAILEKLSFDDWLKYFSHIFINQLKPDTHSFFQDSSKDTTSQTISYMLSHRNGPFGFPCEDFREFIRASIENIDTNLELVYDLTELIDGEYFDKDDNFCSIALRYIVDEYILNPKIIVLTEGKFDKLVLENSLRLLYPHLSEYYSFMDYQSSKSQGGAGTLALTLKVFIGAGIINRIVAFFDNDTAASAAMRSLEDITIPPNVRVSTYPDIPVADSYPTLGPQGTVDANINGLACSIELYLGQDVLANRDGFLTPVQWKSYDELLHQYQGEVINKAELQRRFKSKLKACQRDPSLVEQYDWSSIRAILNSLLTAFH